MATRRSGKNMEASENRRRERHRYDKNILCFQCTNTGTHKVKIPFIISVRDISYGGMGIACKQLLPKGSKVSFRLTEDTDSRVFDVEVKWTKFNGEYYIMGTEFTSIVKEDIVFLFNTINNLG